MRKLLLLIVSYGSLLLLLMPATGAGIISAVIMFLLGTCFIVYKKGHTAAFWHTKEYFLLLASIIIVIYLGHAFYNLWLPSSKMQAVANLLHMPIEAMLQIGSFVLSILAAYFLYVGFLIITKKLSTTNERNYYERTLLFCMIPAIITVVLSQFMINIEIVSMGYWNFMWNMLIVASVILFFFCLSGGILPSIFLGSGIFMVISTINVYVYQFRGRLFEPVDIFSAGTAMNVAENYSLFPVPEKILIGWGLFAAMLIVFIRLKNKQESGLTVKNRMVLLLACSITFGAIFFYTANLKTYHWQKEGVSFNGYILDFVSKFKEINAQKPDNYSAERIAELAEQYAADSEELTFEESNSIPHIIVIMDEAFSDLRVAGNFSTNTEVMPFISSLKENTISGHTLVSVYGGNTANSEYEFLTGNSLAWLSPNVVPYQQYVRSSTYSMMSYLKSSHHYKCVAMHPFHSTGWNRPVAYDHLGFDECCFLDVFPQQDMIREYVSDREMFEFVIDTYEAQKENPLFLFGVTMQNHGGYIYSGPNYTKSISLSEYEGQFPEVEQYLSLIHETDKAVEYLITYFQNVEEEVVIVFFGDHQPAIDESFYETISGTSANTLGEQQKRYKIPFFIWTNYDIEEEYLDCTSLNYLSSYVYDVAGIPLPPYNRFLRELEEKIPAINANGYYSYENGCYLPIEEARGIESDWLGLYELLQYNNLFDKVNQNRLLFPILE